MIEVIKAYQVAKELGRATAVKPDLNPDQPENLTYAIMNKQWDSSSGDELPEQVRGINKGQLMALRQDLLDQIAVIDAFFTDVDPDVVANELSTVTVDVKVKPDPIQPVEPLEG